ncbi:PREDICTED: F-box/kelch-repeat protein At2g24250-like [Camelina sativa]|uniref:F-box/kelch-repeat protein At2g24250-like n=1 Tax=Camelina sativa TaxID=90675 RepID=A0ABM0TUD6_CAMSA|nr:PREDICTED: F-box/kelch-repeat protein At2g24250-like [Camelina sativa]
MAEPATKKKEKISSLYPDWSQLPEELLHLISKNMKENNCFDVVHARSVCTSWRSAFAFPSSLLRPRYSIPTFKSESEDLFTLEKIPLFLFRVKTPPPTARNVVLPCEYFLGAISRDNHMELLPSPLECSMEVTIPGAVPTFVNMRDCQIIPLGHKYRLIDWETSHVAFLPVDKEGGGEFVVLRSCYNCFMVFASVEKRWKRLKNIPHGVCSNIVTFRGRFYASHSGEVFVIDPYSLKVTLLFPPPQDHVHFLVPCGNDELFLVRTIIPGDGVSQFSRLTCRVSRLNEKAGTWVEVSNLGDHVFFITGHFGNFSCSVKELPHGCGLTENSILFTQLPRDIAFPYIYGVHTRNSWKNCLVKLNTSFPIMAFPAEHY